MTMTWPEIIARQQQKVDHLLILTGLKVSRSAGYEDEYFQEKACLEAMLNLQHNGFQHTTDTEG